MNDVAKPDFINLVKTYQSLSKGHKAEIRRAVEPDALLQIPGFYHLLQKAGLKPNTQSCRIAWFLPLVEHREQSESLGRIMKKKDVKERRLFQVVRSEYPNDLVQLHRIVKHIKVSLNWEDFGNLLYYWGQTRERSKQSKQKLMKDYYLNNEAKEQKGDTHE